MFNNIYFAPLNLNEGYPENTSKDYSEKFG